RRRAATARRGAAPVAAVVGADRRRARARGDGVAARARAARGPLGAHAPRPRGGGMVSRRRSNRTNGGSNDAMATWADAALAPWRLALQTTQALTPAWWLAPQTLTQPINPGWTFGNLIQVTEQNSSAPDTEQEIVRHYSYGRQIGRVMDAVDLLLEKTDAKTRADERAKDFEELQRDVQAIKRAQTAARLRRLRDEMVRLKRDPPDEWRELRALLQP